ncbi:WecB/TagA/CpsF family glycosyltransferase [Mucilaginibacter sp. RS28]|uniref:WecB/TagA/CpsF family glycosyltransferase n=1 Tax=Mucilaginibacter straminoryzae TaxID=2932774 RepID=A0A9X2BCK2_9SPHI|nr:WecB/TagA/CpsF family glycosyltransferase [Mucilaginibacter straminoryzae]MCJ8211007.1 WecB/TagA/CpsF family glycosyltransferase [Mucilaginibacter straminoryzae]
MRPNQQPYSFSDYPLFTKTLNELPDQSNLLVNTINQYSYCMANIDAGFKESLQKSDVLLPDGVGVVVAARLLSGKKIKKIAGADVHEHLLKDLDKKAGKCFYLGASDETLKKITDKISQQYPNIKIGSYSPPYKKEFTDEDNQKMIAAVNEFQPDVLFVGMTAPKQEKWAYQHKELVNAKIICTIGAVFDFYAGTVQRPSQVWINLGLEWLGRLVKEPKRLWRRYLYYGPVFLKLIAQEKLKQAAKGHSDYEKMLLN